MDSNLIILAGGASSRMKKPIASGIALTIEETKQADRGSKCLISINKSGRPLLDYLLYNAKKAGYSKIFIVTGKENEQFKMLYGKQPDNDFFHGLTINYAIQHIPEEREKPLGTADALYQALIQFPELKNNSFTVCNSDNLYSIRSLQLLKKSRSTPNSLISYDRNMLEFSEERISKFALILIDKNQYLVDIVEKPSVDALVNYKDEFGKLRISMNIFSFDGSMFFKYLENCPLHPVRQEKELPTALLNMVRDNPTSTSGVPLSEHVPDLTSKEDILIVKEYVKHINLSNW